MFYIKKFLAVISIFLLSIISVKAEEQASAVLSFHLDDYIKIEPITSPVLVANITDRTGNLYSPLSTRFRVITNSANEKTLYLKSNVITEAGFEESMFEQGGRVYVAFANITKQPKSSSLASCKMGGKPTDSPGVVAYPIISLTGATHKFNKSINKYEVLVKNGSTLIDVNIGANVLPNSFGANDPQGFYQAILSLTEVDI